MLRMDVRKEMNVEEEVVRFGQSRMDILQWRRTLTVGDPSPKLCQCGRNGRKSVLKICGGLSESEWVFSLFRCGS